MVTMHRFASPEPCCHSGWSGTLESLADNE